jgi:ATP-dependent DNA helicase DinG
MKAEKRFTASAMESLRGAIADAGGNEVFALGYCDEIGLVSSLQVKARGDEESVLAVDSFFTLFEEGDESPDVFIHNHPSGFLCPSDADFSIAAGAASSGIGAYIVDNGVQNVYVVAEPVRRQKRQALDADALCAELEEGGRLASSLSVYEKRDAQLALIRLVSRAFNDDAIAAAEAGTGVGKSFAYLLPAVTFALLNNERVVVSTATINLQQQLYEKDIPLLTRALGKKIKTALMKGRGNYLCRRRLAEALQEPPLDEAELNELKAVYDWAGTTKTGGRSELPFLPSESLWGRVCSEGDTCMGMRCAERERCFFLALRRECADARLIVVNHHLLFADLAARYEGAGYEGAVVLPPYRRVIIDEAHNIENSATSFFSKEFSRLGISRSLGRLYRKRGARETGLLVKLAALLAGKAALPGEDGEAEAAGGANGRSGAVPKKIRDAVNQVRDKAERADDAALSLCGESGVLRLTPATAGAAPGVLFPELTELRKAITKLGGYIGDLIEDADKNKGKDPQIEIAVREARAVLRRLEGAATVCTGFVEYAENPDEVFWIEKRANPSRTGRFADPWATLSETPIDVAPQLRDALFDANKTVVCVSATLCTGGAGSSGGAEGCDRAADSAAAEKSFAYWAGRSGAGIAKRELLLGIFPSPFPYASRSLLAVPADAPLPDSADYQEFVNAACQSLVLASGGSALVLFTSYSSLKSAFAAASPALAEAGIRCLKQGDDDRGRLLENFLGDEQSVLFATDSFWEGVDAPGDTLRLVIICRLPFRTPNEPVFEARRELLEKRGGNSFMDLSLPDAVMKFKQGFGRLMRRSSDHGVVAVLDGRIVKKFYGKAFLAALPETRRSFKDLQSVARDVESFLF